MSVHRLDNVVRTYAWGHPTALAELQGRPPGTEPEAELWLGAHPSGPSTLTREGGDDVPLDRFLADEGAEFLPPGCTELPFLLKILTIGGPLSIQVHPDPEQARAGFDAAEASGRPVDDPTRSYKDPYAKPEVVVALEPMRVLVGLLDPQERRRFTARGGMRWLEPLVESSPSEFVTAVFDLDEGAAAAALAEVKAAELPADRRRMLDGLADAHPGDRGILVASCMNLVHLAPGQALFTADGVLHAYLDGTAVEIMNPSDNVLRAGLTTKHVDVAELARILRDDQSRPTPVDALPLPDGGERIPLWTDEVGLRRYSGACEGITLRGLTIVLATSSGVTVTVDGRPHEIGAGRSVLVTGDHEASVDGGQVYLASTPDVTR